MQQEAGHERRLWKGNYLVYSVAVAQGAECSQGRVRNPCTSVILSAGRKKVVVE